MGLTSIDQEHVVGAHAIRVIDPEFVRVPEVAQPSDGAPTKKIDIPIELLGDGDDIYIDEARLDDVRLVVVPLAPLVEGNAAIAVVAAQGAGRPGIVLLRPDVGAVPVVLADQRQFHGVAQDELQGRADAQLVLLAQLALRTVAGDCTFVPAIRIQRIGGEPGVDPTLHQGHVHRGAHVAGAVLAQRQLAGGCEFIRGPLGAQLNGPGGGVATEQGALGAAQNLQLLHVEHVQVVHDRAGVVDAVDHDGHRRVKGGVHIRQRVAADGRVQHRGQQTVGQVDVGRQKGHGGQVGREGPVQPLPAQHGGGHRRLLQGLLPLAGGADHFLQDAVASFQVVLIFRRGWRRCAQQQNRQTQKHGTRMRKTEFHRACLPS